MHMRVLMYILDIQGTVPGTAGEAGEEQTRNDAAFDTRTKTRTGPARKMRTKTNQMQHERRSTGSLSADMHQARNMCARDTLKQNPRKTCSSVSSKFAEGNVEVQIVWKMLSSPET